MAVKVYKIKSVERNNEKKGYNASALSFNLTYLGSIAAESAICKGKRMQIEKRNFGKTKNNETVTSYILRNKNGMEAEFIDYGAILVRLLVPDKNGKKSDIVLGYDDVSGYEESGTYFGGFIGRCGNRIADGKFSIGDKEYQLEKNDNGINNLHGGVIGYNKVMYEAEKYEEKEGGSIEFSRLSPDMEQGFPGNLDITVTYTLTEENELVIEYLAVPDKDTIVNLTNHSYFNLKGHNSGTILDQKVKIYADSFTKVDKNLIPTGELVSVDGSPMDFRDWKTIGKEIENNYEQLLYANGYDHNYAVHTGKGVVLVAEAKEEQSNRRMEVYTDLPGIQFYTGNFLDGSEMGKEKCAYKKRTGFCFETQKFPNAVNIPDFESPFVQKGQQYDTTTIYKFYW